MSLPPASECRLLGFSGLELGALPAFAPGVWPCWPPGFCPACCVFRMAMPDWPPDCFICSISVSICLTICFCLPCVSSLVSGLPSRSSTSLICLTI